MQTDRHDSVPGQRSEAPIYLDHNATTPLRPEVRTYLLNGLQELGGNASSLHASGRRARHRIDEARERVAAALGVAEDGVLFTSGGTESNNLALFGSLAALGADAALATTRVEHSSVLEPALELEQRERRVYWIDVGPDGVPDLASLDAALAHDDCRLLSTMAANNEVGAVAPLEAIAERVAAQRERGLRWHVDGVQALGRIPLRPADLGIDLLTLSAHKVGGPIGVGILFQRPGTRLSPLFYGGQQERGLRPGTENALTISAAALAIELAVSEQESTAERQRALTHDTWHALRAACPEARLLGPAIDDPRRLPNTLNVSLAELDGKVLVTRLDLAGLAVGAGSACASGSVEPSHVLLAMGVNEERARSGVRITLGRATTRAECLAAVEILRKVSDRSHAT